MEHHNHVTVIVLVFVLQLAQMDVKESARDVKAVVKMVAKTHVEEVVGKNVKDVAMQPVRVTA